MKVFVMVNNYKPVADSGNIGWYLLADSSVSNTGKPFYLPDNKGKTIVSLTGAIRILRLGKAVASKFASRYYSEIAPALHFRLPDFEKELISEGLPGDASRNFDRALMVGEFFPIEKAGPLELIVNGEKKNSFILDSLNKSVDEIFPMISNDNTIKMGDLILPGLSGEIELSEGDMLEVMAGGEKAFHVKVK